MHICIYAQPNDDCSGAIAIACGGNATGSTVGAGSETIGFCGTTDGTGGGVWYSIVGTGDQMTASLAGSSYDTRIRVFEGTCGALVCVDGDDDGGPGLTSVINWSSTIGTAYYILVHGYASSEGIYNLNITCTPPSAHDMCTTAIPVSCGDVINGTTVGAGSDSEGFCGTSDGTGGGVWYDFVGTGDMVTISTAGSSFDTKLRIFEGTCNALVCVDGDDDGGPGVTSQVIFNSSVGTVYHVLLHGFSNSEGIFQLSLTCDNQITNDQPCGATFMGLVTAAGVSAPVDLTTATADPGEVSPGAGTGASSCQSLDGWCSFETNVQNSLWYAFIAPPSGNVRIETNANNTSQDDSQIAVYLVSSCSDYSTFIEVAANDDSGILNNALILDDCNTLGLIPGFLYFIQVDGQFGDDVIGDLIVSEIPVGIGSPFNDLCANATCISCGDVVTGSTVCATPDAAPFCGTSNTANGVWFSFTGDGNYVTLNTNGSDFDTKLTAYTDGCGMLTYINGDDDGGVGLQSEIGFCTEKGATYLVLIHGFSTANGDFTLSMSCSNVPLGVSTTPCQTLLTGYAPLNNAPITLSASAYGGSSPYTCSWASGPSIVGYGANPCEVIVLPSIPTTYTVTITDANGCTATGTSFVDVVDISCGANKVQICHQNPNGSESDFCIPVTHVPAHLSHGDRLGSCSYNCPTPVLPSPGPQPITGILTNHVYCMDTLDGVSIYIIDTDGNIVQDIAPAVTDVNGYFQFDAVALAQFNQCNNAVDSFSFIGEHGEELLWLHGGNWQSLPYNTIDDWINQSPINLSFNELVTTAWKARVDTIMVEHVLMGQDAFGNTYVAGRFPPPLHIGNTACNSILAKFDENGIEQWRTCSPIAPEEILVAPNGTLYITGKIASNGNTLFPGTAKYDNNGVRLWLAIEAVLGNLNALTLDAQGNVYVTGKGRSGFSNPSIPDNLLMIKYSSTGIMTHSTVNRYGEGHDIWVDDNSDIIITGTSNDSLITIKYDQLGTEYWAALHQGANSTPAKGMQLVLDQSDNIYVTGTSSNNGSDLDYLTMKFDKNGNQKWMQYYDGPNGLDDTPSAIKLDSDDNILITGKSTTQSGAPNVIKHDYATIKYDNNGTTQWVRRFDSPGGLNDEAIAMTIGQDNTVYVTGRSGGIGETISSTGTNSGYDAITIKYNPTGAIAWTKKFNGDENKFDGGTAIIVNSNKKIYVAAASTSDQILAFNGIEQPGIAILQYDECIPPPSISGILIDNPYCNNIPLPLHEIIFISENGDTVHTITPAVSDQQGQFRFDPVELNAFNKGANKNKRFQLALYSGDSIVQLVNGIPQTVSAKTIDDWITISPVQLALWPDQIDSVNITANPIHGNCSDTIQLCACLSDRDLFISEYVEGSGQNRYLEIYNPTGCSVDLSDYSYEGYHNGSSTPTFVFNLSGNLDNDAVVILSHPSSNTIFAGALTSFSLAFNGDDAIILRKNSTNEIVDVIGQPGIDPGSAWTSGNHSTQNKTLRRKASVFQGIRSIPTNGFPTLVSEWEVYPINDVSGLGFHHMNDPNNYEWHPTGGNEKCISISEGQQNYTVQVTDTFGCKLFDTITIGIISLEANFNSTPIKCNRFHFEPYTPANALVTHQWDFGDGSTSTDPDPIHDFTTPSTVPVGVHSFNQDVTLIITYENHFGITCSDTIIKILTICTDNSVGGCPDLDVSFDADSTCLEVQFDPVITGANINPNSNITYNWHFGDGQTSTGSNPIHQYTQPGMYEVVLAYTLQWGNPTNPVNCIYTDTQQISIGTNGNLILSAGGNFTTCTDAMQGYIDLTVSGGQAPYTYNWTNGENTQDVGNLPGGSYEVLVTDAQGCIVSQTFGITELPAMALTAIPTPLSCNGHADGAIDLTVSSGQTPYAFAWSNGASTEDVNGLEAGNYTVTVIDANGCVDSLTVDLQPNLADSVKIEASATSVICNDSVLLCACLPERDLFFSEYVEGSGLNKYIEIYNPTVCTIDLADYTFEEYHNGASLASGPSFSFGLSGYLNDGEVLLLAHPAASIFTGSVVATSAVSYNGNDAIVLRKNSTNAIVDIIGRAGEQPGAGWTAGNHSTKDKTLRRKPFVTDGIKQNPASGFPTLESEWDVFPLDDANGLGFHQMADPLSYTWQPNAGNQRCIYITPGHDVTYNVTVTDTNGCERYDSLDIQVAGLEVAFTGRHHAYAGQNIRLEIILTNTTGSILNNITLSTLLHPDLIISGTVPAPLPSLITLNPGQSDTLSILGRFNIAHPAYTNSIEVYDPNCDSTYQLEHTVGVFIGCPKAWTDHAVDCNDDVSCITTRLSYHNTIGQQISEDRICLEFDPAYVEPCAINPADFVSFPFLPPGTNGNILNYSQTTSTDIAPSGQPYQVLDLTVGFNPRITINTNQANDTRSPVSIDFKLVSAPPPTNSTSLFHCGNQLTVHNPQGVTSTISLNSDAAVFLFTGNCWPDSLKPDCGFTLSPDTIVCANTPITITADEPEGIHKWILGDNSATIAGSPTLVHTYTQAGFYWVEHIVVKDGFACIDSVLIEVIPVHHINANAGPDQLLCPENFGVQLQGSGGDIYHWSPPLGLDNPNIPNPFANPSQTQTYTLSVTSEGCANTSMDKVTVFVPPAVNAGDDVSICWGDKVSLLASGQGAYTWSPPLGLSHTNRPDPVANPLQTSTYTVTLTDNNGCTSTDDITVTVTPAISLNIPDVVLCPGEQYVLNPNPDPSLLQGDYAWTPDIGLSCSSCSSPVVSVLEDRTYDVLVKVDNCTAYTQVNVSMDAFATVEYAYSKMAPLTYNFTAFPGGQLLYHWDFGDGQTSSLQNPTHTFPEPREYQVCLEVESRCGTRSVCKRICVEGDCSNSG